MPADTANGRCRDAADRCGEIGPQTSPGPGAGSFVHQEDERLSALPDARLEARDIARSEGVHPANQEDVRVAVRGGRPCRRP